MALRKNNQKDYNKFADTGTDVLKNKKSNLIFSKADQTKDPRTGETVYTESMQNDEDFRIPVQVSRSKENFGLFTVKKEDGSEVPVNPSHESIVPRSVVKDVPRGRSQQEAIGEYNKLRKK